MDRDGFLRALLALVAMAAGVLAAWAAGASTGALIPVAVATIAALFVLAPVSRSTTMTLSPSVAPPAAPPAEAFIEAVSEPMLVVADSRVAAANAAARTLLGAHIVNEDVRIAIRHPAAAERLLAGVVDPEPIDLTGVGGREARWQMQVRALDAGRRLVHLIDRSGSHAAERMRVDFVANASHELRTPLSAILGFVETLDDDNAGADRATRKRFLKVMHDEAQRMQRLVEDLMSLSRIEAEKYRLPDAAVDLAQLVVEAHAVVRDGESTRGRDVGIDLDDDMPFVAGDAAQLSQLLHNLIGNAMKYGRADTPITVRLTRGAGSMIRLSVTDEGDGIAPEHLPRLTERFYRVDSSRSRALGGTGLGLAIVKHIAERHRGRLEIASTVGQGTTVTVLLPPRPAAAVIKESRDCNRERVKRC